MLILRAICLAVWFFSSCLVLSLLGLFKPLNPINSYRFSRYVCPVAIWILGIKLVLRNTIQLSRAQPCVFIVNHQHLIDAFIVGVAAPKGTVVIGKKSLKWIPIFGWLFYLSGSLLIDRKNTRRAMETMKAAEERLVRKRWSVLVAPEGTRSHGGPMAPFKKGAFYLAVNTGLPLQPYVASSFHKGLNFWKWRAGTVIIEALDPIPTMGKRASDIDELMAISHERMRLAVDRLDEEVSAKSRLP